MIRNITVDGEAALAVDTAEELGRALLTGRYVVASDAVRAEYGLTDTDNSDTQDIVDESDWRDDAWRAAGEFPPRYGLPDWMFFGSSICSLSLPANAVW